MKSETDHSKDYKQAEKAYLQGNYEEAASIIDLLMKDLPSDPSVRLLRGHIYCYGLQHYDIARSEYQTVLDLTSDSDFVEYAGNGLAYANQFLEQDGGDSMVTDIDASSRQIDLNIDDWVSTSSGFGSDPVSGFANDPVSGFGSDPSSGFANDPISGFGSNAPEFGGGNNADSLEAAFNQPSSAYFEHQDVNLSDFASHNPFSESATTADMGLNANLPDPFDDHTAAFPSMSHADLVDSQPGDADADSSAFTPDHAFGEGEYDSATTPNGLDSNTQFSPQDWSAQFGEQTNGYGTPDETVNTQVGLPNTGGTKQEDAPILDWDQALGIDSNSSNGGGDILADLTSGTLVAPERSNLIINDLEADKSGEPESPMTGVTVSHIQGDGPFGAFVSAPFSRKQTIMAAATGSVAALLVLLGAIVAQPSNDAQKNGWGGLNLGAFLTAVVAGAGSGAMTYALSGLAYRQVKHSATHLRNQFELVAQGNWDTEVVVTSRDELGQVGASFNQLLSGFKSSISDLQSTINQQERQKEDLQRQVIRLLDDVEGAARGDLTVQAEVTADVLGAVADSFNLTIQNLREIVVQVKEAARQVNLGSGESESFARSLSSDALEQAEQLAATLQSVQMMTDSIQRVAVSAREAEEVAQLASKSAVRGGEAVERTVAGILDIRETVAESTRKVKRLAESSQEISKIVAVISSIASRTNLLALNASIEAARAGEAGRGFAIVADEVRQLADRAAKASKEIEGIVLQIQSDTGSVMTAMEEGTQQVIQGTKLAEQAKRSLDDIIQVSTKIDDLVRSITANTEEQNETSRSVAQVMQSVELTAQETSQEAQKVSASLQNLVGVARGLLTSVERFRVEST